MVAPQIVPDAPQVEQQRRVRVVGYVRGPRRDGLDCDRPLRVLVSDAGEPYRPETWRCSNHRSSRCGPCASRYRGRVESVANEGLFRSSGFYYFVTLTAPSDVGSHCLRAGCDGTSCSHKRCACTPQGGIDLAEWNPTAARRWNHLLVALERRYSSRPAYFRSVEVQDGHRSADSSPGRGALHLHVLVWTPRKWSVRTLRELAISAGFGHSVDLKPIAPGSRSAARYVSKYVSKSCDRRDDVPWTALHTDPATGQTWPVDAAATFRTWSQSATWGKTLRELRNADLDRYRRQEAVRRLLDQVLLERERPATPGPEPAD